MNNDINDIVEVLVVIKDPTERNVTVDKLRDYKVISACSKEQALLELNNNPKLELLILDTELEGMEDFRFLEEIHERNLVENLHIIIITGYNDIDKEIIGVNKGAADYVRRPINYETLLMRVKRHLVFVSLNRMLGISNNNPRMKDYNLNDSLERLGSGIVARERLFSALFEQANLGITVGHNGKYLDESFAGTPTINKKFLEITGRTYEELLELGWEAITHPDDLEMDREWFTKLWNDEIEDFQMEKRYVRADGTSVWVDMKICRLNIENLGGFSYICFVEDISKRKIFEENLRASENSKDVLLSNLPGLAYRCKYDRDWTMEFVSEGCKEITGYGPENLIHNRDLSFNELILPQYRKYLVNKWEEAVGEKKRLSEEYQILTADGEIKWVLEQGQAIYDDKGEVVSLEGLIIDINLRKENEMKLRFINEHDPLTGIFNRRYFASYVGNMEDVNGSVAILANIKNFSLINLTYGYTFAEELIVKIGKSLNEINFPGVTIFHISIDRFVILVERYQNQEDIESLCWDIISRLDESISINTIHGYLGVLKLGGVGRDVEKILKFTSIAAKGASENQNTRFSIFNDQMERDITRKEIIQNELASFVENNHKQGLFMVFQPIIDIKSFTINGFEALARFMSPDLGQLSPLEFIDIAEDTQLIVPLGRQIIRKSLEFLKETEKMGFGNLLISINISLIQILREDFVPNLVMLASEQGVDLDRITLELTESIFSNDFSDINYRLSQLKELGVEIAIDDFGTGYSSLSRERELDINCLKIDKSFINRLEYLEDGESITSDIISLAHKLGQIVVAEGVETKKQLDYLLRHGCDYVQGYLFSKPMTKEDSLEYLVEYGNNVVFEQ